MRNFWLALALVFIVLKLTAVVAWSWWWVLSPLAVPIIGFILVGMLLIIAAD